MGSEKNKNDGMVTYRRFSLTLVSAENLPNVRKKFKNRVEARVKIVGENGSPMKRSKPDKRNGSYPAWNHRIRYVIAETGVVNHDVPVVIKLYSSRRFLCDKYIGEVHRSVKALFELAKSHENSATLALPVTRGSAPTDAVLNISYSFGEKFEMEKPAAWKKTMAAGASLVLRLVAIATLGIDVEIPIYVEDEIVDADRKPYSISTNLF